MSFNEILRGLLSVSSELPFPYKFIMMTKSAVALRDLIEVDKELLGGEPVFKNTRVAIKTLFDYLEESSLEEFLIGHPTVNRQQAEAVIEFASEQLLSKVRA